MNLSCDIGWTFVIIVFWISLWKIDFFMNNKLNFLIEYWLSFFHDDGLNIFMENLLNFFINNWLYFWVNNWLIFFVNIWFYLFINNLLNFSFKFVYCLLITICIFFVKIGWIFLFIICCISLSITGVTSSLIIG